MFRRLRSIPERLNHNPKNNGQQHILNDNESKQIKK
jgi:hypothetical protein